MPMTDAQYDDLLAQVDRAGMKPSQGEWKSKVRPMTLWERIKFRLWDWVPPPDKD